MSQVFLDWSVLILKKPLVSQRFNAGMNTTSKGKVDKAEKEIEKLCDQINEHNYRYHVLDDPVITDAEFDKLFQHLKSLEAQYPELITQDSPTQRVGAAPLKSFAEVQHDVAMLSLDNAFTEEEIFNFDQRIRDRLHTKDQIEYCCEPKLDGLAVN